MDNSNNYDELFKPNNIFVCEWFVVDCEYEFEGEKSQILQTYDFTYHPEFEAAKYAASMDVMGYGLAKELIRNSLAELPNTIKNKKIFCHNIWVYDDGLLIGKFLYSENRKSWYPYLKQNQWELEVPDLIQIPLPKN